MTARLIVRIEEKLAPVLHLPKKLPGCYHAPLHDGGREEPMCKLCWAWFWLFGLFIEVPYFILGDLVDRLRNR